MVTKRDVRNSQYLQDNPTYYRISFRGKARAYSKYLKLQDICEEALSWLGGIRYTDLSNGLTNSVEDALDLSTWMTGTGGFVRPHMPYYVTLTPHEYAILIYAVRRAGTEHREYMWLRQYGEWT